MAGRIFIAALLCILVAGLAWWLEQPATDLTRRAQALAGERWFALSLEERHLGYLRTHNYTDADGNWVFESEQRFAMNPYDAAATTTRRVFAGPEPHALISARHLQTRRGRAEGVQIEASETGYRASRLPEDGTVSSRFSWQYALADYLDFELWLAREQPAAGRSRSVMTLNFDRLEPVRRTFEVVDLDSGRYTIENGAPLTATRIQLDDRFAPTAMTIAGLFNLELVSKEEALAPRSALQAASYHIPINRRLANHTRISELELAISGHESPRTLFPAARRSEDRWTLKLRHDPRTNGRAGPEHEKETVQIPARHSDIRALARSAVSDLGDDASRASALNQFVHGFITYKPGHPPQSVLTLLESRLGDCTEFADLLTSLARSIGLPARTVFGLAYADGQEPAFAYHAWNEIFLDGDWQPFDPTWGQDRVDATHIPLPDDETAAMLLLTGAVSLRFDVLDVQFFSD